MKSISILGSTGSIGTQTLDVARWRGYRVKALSAGKNKELLLKQIAEFKPELVSCDESIAKDIKTQAPASTRVISGEDAAEELASFEVDTVVAAIPGIAGLKPTLAALREGRHVALANKEAMVVAGPLVWELARKHGASITPVDSEHSALFQCLVGEATEGIAELVLTASGGPFRLEPSDLSLVTPEQALKHPNWAMGAKVSIDSSTLFNKGLEVLEAHFLFEIPLKHIDVVIHPQSLIHSFVRYKDGNIKAQIGPHDMRIPIHYALEYPNRPEIPLEPLALKGTWELHPPDHQRFPSLSLAYRAGEMAGLAPCALNAADEIAVEAFLAKRISYIDIAKTLELALERLNNQALSWEGIEQIDLETRALLKEELKLT